MGPMMKRTNSDRKTKKGITELFLVDGDPSNVTNNLLFIIDAAYRSSLWGGLDLLHTQLNYELFTLLKSNSTSFI